MNNKKVPKITEIQVGLENLLVEMSEALLSYDSQPASLDREYLYSAFACLLEARKKLDSVGDALTNKQVWEIIHRQPKEIAQVNYEK